MSSEVTRHEPAGHADSASVKLFGFWVYLMSDCILFACLFLSFAVLHSRYAGGPTGRDIFELKGVLSETLCLLASSFPCGLATLALRAGRRGQLVGWVAATFVLGAAFVAQEAVEFSRLVLAGHGPGQSAFLSAFFALVGTHGLHLSFGLLWMAVLTGQVLLRGLAPAVGTRILMLSLFWHFLDIVWICLFTLVYLAGVL